MRRRIVPAPAVRPFLAALAFLAAACEEPVPVPTTLEKVSGDEQVAEVTATLPDPLVVRVLDQNGEAMGGVPVSWAAEAGTVTGGTSTEADGTASATWTLGTAAGGPTATASLTGTATATFGATAVPGDMTVFTVSPEELVFDAVGETGALTAAGEDAHGNEVVASVAWSSRDTDVAQVDDEGLVEATGNGETWVVAQAEGLSDSARVVVEPSSDRDPDLVGEWLGISYLLENQDASQEIDVVVEEGWLMELDFNQDGTWSYLETYADAEIGWSDAGAWYTRNDTIVLYSGTEQDSLYVPYTKPGPDLFSYTTEGEESWDFDGDGVDEVTASETAILARRIDAELVGTWEAESMVMVDANDESRSVDVIAEGGSLTVTFHADGTIVGEQVEPDLNDQWYLDGQTHTFTATYAAAGPFLWVVESGGTEQLFSALDGDLLTVVSVYEVDIEGDGTEEAIIETTQLRRQ